MWLFKNHKNKPAEPTQEEPIVEEVEIMPDNKQTVNDIMKRITDREYVTVSPIDGEYMSVIRSEDVMSILCDYFNVDGKDTEYSDYA